MMSTTHILIISIAESEIAGRMIMSMITSASAICVVEANAEVFAQLAARLISAPHGARAYGTTRSRLWGYTTCRQNRQGTYAGAGSMATQGETLGHRMHDTCGNG